jgi:hypothetical protein
LADVFTTLDSEYVFFIGINRGSCFEKIITSNADSFSQRDSHGYHFMCMFNGNVPVISEFVAPTASSFLDFIYLFCCKVPDQFKEQIQSGQLMTSLNLDLHPLHDLEQPTIGTYNIQVFPSRVISDLPKVADIQSSQAVSFQIYQK